MTVDEIKKLDVASCNKFANFAKDKLPMPGKKKRLDEILNREIVVTDFRITKSKRKEGTDCLQMQFILDDDIFILFTGSAVLADQIQSARDNMPFRGTIVRIDKYYSFS